MSSKEFRYWAGAGALVLSLASTNALAAATDLTDKQSTGRWFVELNTPVETFRARAAASGIDLREHYSYKRVWKGVSVEASREGASMLGKLAGVVAVYPVLVVPRPETQPSAPELATALAMTGADVAQTAGWTGTGIKVAVMDTGIDYHHPDLGGGFGAGRRVTTGYDFVGDRYDAGGSGGALIAHPDNDPDDCNGHGTHVAGIIGASGNPATGGARGVAPGVTFGAYRVFGCDGSTSADIMLAAMERALNDGMHVLNMSIGSSFQTWPQYPTAVGADALVAAGMVVVASIGNSGANGVYSAGAPGVGRRVIGVGSFDNSHIALPVFTVSPDDAAIGYTGATAAGPTPTTGSFPMARTGTTTSAADACATSGALADLTGKVVLIRRGTCGFYEKARRAELAGAAAVVLYNNVAGRINPTVAVSTGADGNPVTIPVVAISDTEGALINGRLAGGAVTMTWTDDSATFANATGGLMSAFSSFGLTAELEIKPDVGAPGGFIRSTYPLEAGGYATIGGTSMSSPHVAGAAALFLQAHPSATQADILTALQNNATPARWSGNAGPQFIEFVHRQGAGMIDIPAAITATSSVTPSKLSLGEGTAATPKAVQLTIENRGTSSLTLTPTHVRALATAGSTFAPGATTAGANVTFGSASVVVPAGGSATLDVTITPPTSQGLVYGGHLVLTPSGAGAEPLRVPYAGFSGDYQLVQVLAAGGCPLSPFPGIFRLGGVTACNAPAPPAVPATLDVAVTRQGEGASFNVADRNDRPVILYHRAHQSRSIEIRAVDAATNASYPVASSDYVGRDPTNGISFQAGGFSAYIWDGKQLFTNAAGKVQRKELPSGAYKLQLVVTKALAVDGNAAHVETWTSPTIVITH
jgi:minor extracellular serine protease Vpr